MEEIISEEKDIEVAMEKVDKLQDKAKYAAFDKTKIKCKKATKVV